MREHEGRTDVIGGDRHDRDRLETPRVAGYRSGMSSVGFIGRKLARVYDVHDETPRAIGTLLHALDRKLSIEG